MVDLTLNGPIPYVAKAYYEGGHVVKRVVDAESCVIAATKFFRGLETKLGVRKNWFSKPKPVDFRYLEVEGSLHRQTTLLGTNPDILEQICKKRGYVESAIDRQDLPGYFRYVVKQ